MDMCIIKSVITEEWYHHFFQDQLTQSVRVKLSDLKSQLELDPNLSEEEKAAKLKSEKIKIALEKLKRARVQKVRDDDDDNNSNNNNN